MRALGLSAFRHADACTLLPAQPAPPASAPKPQLAAVEGRALFAGLDISPQTKRAICDDMGYASMTPVQEATLPVILSGRDVLAKAKTGTGKTLAFLVPTIEALLRAGPRASSNSIRALVLSPTRELAQQTAAEAKALTAHHAGMRTGVIVGGTGIGGDAGRMSGVDILIATPGRLKDHCENTAGFRDRLAGVKILVLDEGDQLLAAGFRPDIERILRCFPREGRQSLCFSATTPPELQAVLGVALKPGHASIDCVGKEAVDTHSAVDQAAAVTSLADQMSILYREIMAERASDPLHKVIVFLPTARQTQFAAEALNAMGLPVLEIHSRKSQSQREKVAAQFRAASAAIMCSSDVSARGVDYPDVTLVIQVGPPSNREQYSACPCVTRPACAC
jgi:ATP-dependent RNA helicase MSS116